ncbi:hypothetical protein Pyn_16065 [Prunus yedoensis var. nudiflora]|uniref:Uncharacterized protein n=1 Tax=Prunus yedoensis var. nudiflora TaxID=2094558 RepID=A0A314ZMU0_PRUYE|nr:hypothetical protein Pyn_16065 [Prunus yedoensis var. nudiflora]
MITIIPRLETGICIHRALARPHIVSCLEHWATRPTPSWIGREFCLQVTWKSIMPRSSSFSCFILIDNI